MSFGRVIPPFSEARLALAKTWAALLPGSLRVALGAVLSLCVRQITCGDTCNCGERLLLTGIMFGIVAWGVILHRIRSFADFSGRVIGLKVAVRFLHALERVRALVQ